MRELATETDIPEQTLYWYAAGHGIIPRERRVKLAHVIGCDAQDLAPMHDVEESPHVRKDMTIKRRELLRLLGIAGGALLVSDIDMERLDASLANPIYTNASVVSDLETITNRCWNLYLASVSKPSVLDGVLGQLNMQTQFLNESHPPEVRQGLCAVTSNMSQLAGEIFFDLHDHDAAQSCYLFAATAAKEAKAYDLWASALIRHSYLPIFNGQHENALPMLKLAERIALRGDSAFPTRYWAAATYAEAESGVGNSKACQRALERAGEVHHIAGTRPPAWTRFDGSRLAALQGACYVRLKEPALAMPVLEKALQQQTNSSRRRGMILSDLAVASIQQGQIENACTYANELVNISAQLSSGFLRSNLAQIQQQLTPFSVSTPVKSLEKHIATLS